jgi:Cu-Zn family superoxide dismutase
MRIAIVIATIVAVTALAGCASMGDEQLMKPSPNVQAVQGPVEMAVLAQARLEPKSGSTVDGLARFAIDRGVVSMDLTLSGLTEGPHAVHLDENGDCLGMDAMSTGPHWNPLNAPHGRFDMPPYHLGDVGNVRADAEGRASLVFATDEWSVGTGKSNDIVGRALVIEERRDDFVTQPDGNSGKHLACGAIELTAGAPAVSALRLR